MDRDSKDHSDTELGRIESRDSALDRIRTANTVMMSPELFERLYLQPANGVKGDLRKTFANPTPLGLVGFVLGLTPLACCLMGWRGSGGLGSAHIAIFYFIGGPLSIFSGLFEYFLGNTFPFVVFTTYGCVFLGLAGTLHPFYASATAYSPEANFQQGFQEPAFNASLAFFPIGVAILNVFFFICATKVNLVFMSMFCGAGIGFTLLSSALWSLAEGAPETAAKLLVGAGSCWFFTAMMGWYLLLIQLLGTMGFKIQLPVGDLSRFWSDDDRTLDGKSA